MNSADDDTSVNIFQNMDNIKKIQLVSYYYNMSLAAALRFTELKCYLVLVKYKYIFLGEICIYPVFEEIIKRLIIFSPHADD